MSADDLEFHAIKKLEVIVHGSEEAFVQQILKEAGFTGYTIIRNVAGMGHHGFHEGQLLFNDQSSLIMVIGVASEQVIRDAAAGLRPLFEQQSGVLFVSDAQVVRLNYFLSDKDQTAPRQ